MGKYVVSVASVAYNLAGDISKRPDVLKTTVLQAMYGRSSTRSLGNIISRSYLNGSGTKLRNYAKWTNTSGYNDVIGKATGNLTALSAIDLGTIESNLPLVPNYTASVKSADVLRNTILPAAISYIKYNYPALLGTGWEADYVNGIVTITFEDATTESFSYVLNTDTQYLVGVYDLTGVDFIDTSTIVNTTTEVTSFASISGLTTISEVSNIASLDLDNKVETIKSYSDGSPTEVTYSYSFRENVAATVVTNSYLSSTVNEDTELRKTHNRVDRVDSSVDTKEYPVEPTLTSTTSEVISGVTVTTVTNTYNSYIKTTKTTSLTSYLYIALDIKIKNWYSYAYGSGSQVLDDVIDDFEEESLGDFFPIIPLRIDNQSVNVTNFPTLTPLVKRALYAQTGKDTYSKLLSSIEDTPDINDLDYVYNIIAVSLNTPELVGRKYLFNFFDALRQVTFSNPNAEKKVTVKAANMGINYHIEITWKAITKTQGSGLYSPTSLPNTVEVVDSTLYSDSSGSTANWLNSIIGKKHTVFKYVWQKSHTEWECLEIDSLMYYNKVYSGKEVTISAFDALRDEEESDFLVPLSINLYNELSIVDATQLATSCSYLLINVYEKKKKKWYQRGIFKVVLVVLAVVITVYTGGLGAGSVGVLGTNLSVGAALGFQGLAAVLVGAAVNALAGMVVTEVITRASIAAFGKEIGVVISSLISLGMNMALNGKTLADMLNANTLITLTKAAGEGYQAYLNRKYQELQKDFVDLQHREKDLLKLIGDKSDTLFGSTNIDLLSVMEVKRRSNVVYSETPDEFFMRTTLDGSTMIDMVLSYVDTTLKTVEVT